MRYRPRILAIVFGPGSRLETREVTADAKVFDVMSKRWANDYPSASLWAQFVAGKSNTETGDPNMLLSYEKADAEIEFLKNRESDTQQNRLRKHKQPVSLRIVASQNLC